MGSRLLKSIEWAAFDTPDEKEEAFHFKLSAALFHRDRMHNIIQTCEHYFANPSTRPPKEVNPFFYHCDALLFELCSCFDVALHVARLKCRIVIPDRQVRWDNKTFRDAIQQANVTAHAKIDAVAEAEWFRDLSAARNYVTHHNHPAILVDAASDGSRVQFITFGMPGMKQHRDLFEQVDRWGRNMAQFWNDLKAVL